MTQLVRYEAARHALAEAHRIDEVKEIRDRAAAAEAYARQARDTEMIRMATEIRVRAERRAGEMLREMAELGERATRADGVKFSDYGRPATSRSPRPVGAPKTLADIGITKDQSRRYQALAAMPAEHFETAVETAKHISGEVSSAFVLRQHAEGTDDVVAVRRRARGPRTKAGKERLAALDAAGSSTYTNAAVRAAIKAIQADPDGADLDLIEQLLSICERVVEQATARLD